MYIGVEKAHLNVKREEQEWVVLPSEFWKCGKYAKLKRWLYGIRKAASGWEEDHAGELKAEGFARGVGAPTTFYKAATKVRVAVHGDDLAFAGVKKEVEKVKAPMVEWYDIKISDDNEVKEITILGRTVKWVRSGSQYEAGGKHRDELMKMNGLEEGSKTVGGAAVRVREEDAEEEAVELLGKDCSKFRGMAARLNFLGQDRSDIQYATKEVCTGMVASDGWRDEDKASGEVFSQSMAAGVDDAGAGRRGEGWDCGVSGFGLGEGGGEEID